MKGSKQDLFHGILAFFRFIFGNETLRLKPVTNIYSKGLNLIDQTYLRELINDLTSLNLEIMTLCSTMLSNIGILDEEI
ncbi:MAG: hypothetical protein IPK55_13585 [Streptococcus sp.]|nr:hypothetical protein [Streptococcus sp.]